MTDIDIPAEVPAEVVPAPGGRAPILNGIFTLYDDGADGLVLVSDTDQLGVRRNHMSRRELKMVSAMTMGRLKVSPDGIREMIAQMRGRDGLD